MIKKDYILRQIKQLLDALISKFSKIQSGDIAYNPEEINDLYLKYLGNDKDFFLNINPKEIFAFLQQNHSREEAFARMSVLSELLFGESKITNNKHLQDKAIHVLTYVNEHSGTFNMDILVRLAEMKKL